MSASEQETLAVPDMADPLPSYIYIARSKIPEAGHGVFTNMHLPKGHDFGPYKGKWLSIEEFEHIPESSLYVWEVKDYRGNKNRQHGVKLRDNETIGYIDGEDPRTSNFLRFINHPCSADAENVQAVQKKDKIHYFATRDIHPGEELYVYYGPEYSKYLLGIDVRE